MRKLIIKRNKIRIYEEYYESNDTACKALLDKVFTIANMAAIYTSSFEDDAARIHILLRGYDAAYIKVDDTEYILEVFPHRYSPECQSRQEIDELYEQICR